MHSSCILLIATFLLCLGLPTTRSFDGLYVVQDPSSKNLTCISENDDAAIIWNYDLTQKNDSDSFKNFKPVKPTPENSTDCAIWMSNQCLVSWEKRDNSTITNSILNPMSPAMDYRWEGFKEYDLEQVTEMDENVLKFPESLKDTLVLSVRGTGNIKICLCGNDNSTTSSHSLIKISIEGKQSFNETCIGDAINDSQQTENRSCRVMQNLTKEAAVLDAYEWRTFRLQWMREKKLLKLFNHATNEAILESRVEKWHSLGNISVNSDAAASLKFHVYDYFLETRKNFTLQTMEFNHSDKNFCVDILMSLCPGCQLNVSLVDGTSGKDLAYTSIFGDEYFLANGLRNWRSIKLNMSLQSALPKLVKLRFRSILKENYRENIWWAMDSLRFYEKTDRTRESTITLADYNTTNGVMSKIKCQKLLHREIVTADLDGSKPSDNVIQLREYIKNERASCSPENENFNGISCTSYGCTCYQGFGKIDGKACFNIDPEKKSLTLVEGSNSMMCSMRNSSIRVEVFEEPGHKSLKKQSCPMLPCAYNFQLNSYAEYNVRVELSDGLTFYNNKIKTLESAPGKIEDLNFTSKLPYKITAEWKPPIQKNGRILNYTVTLQRIHLIGCKDYDIDSPIEIAKQKTVNITTVFFDDLHPYAKYNFTVVANTVEPGPPLEKNVSTQQLDIPTTKVSNLRLIYGQSRLAWDGPEDCTLTTGPTNFVRLIFEGVSDWAKNVTFNITARDGHHRLETKKWIQVPYTRYKVSAYIMRKNNSFVNHEHFQELDWVTEPSAPPRVENILLYEVDADNKTASMKWEPPYPAHGVIESYEVSMVNGRMVYGNWSIKTSDNKLSCGLSKTYVCFQNVSIPWNISSNSEIMLQVFAKNVNVTKNGAENSVMVKLDNFYKTAPGEPTNITVIIQSHGIVILNWMHPLFSPTKIVRFRIHVELSGSNLLINPPMKNRTIDYLLTNDKKVYSKELYLLSSTDYLVRMMAVNNHNISSNKVIEPIEVPKSVDFMSKNTLQVKSDERVIKLEVPAVVNATRNTTVVITVKGISLCEKKSLNNFSPSLNESTNEWIDMEYLVNSSEPSEYTFKTDQSYGVLKRCWFQASENYEFKVKLKDAMENDSLVSDKVTLGDRDPKNTFYTIWLLGIAIALVFPLILFILYRKCKIRMQPTDMFELPLIHPSPGWEDWVVPCTIQQKLPRVITRKGHVSTLGKTQPHFYPVSIQEFEEYVNEALASQMLEGQYKMLPKGISKSCEYGYLPENRSKNQFTDILPYDENRIILGKIPNDPHSDYINASYVQGRRKAKAYIATQGPKRDTETNTNTVPDFWRMVWQENVCVICMLTNVIEDTKRKCEQYWPEIGKSMQIGDATILNTDHQVFVDYTIRTLQLICLEGKREIKHFHYTGWPEHGIPMYTQPLVAFLKKLLVTPPGRGPIVVHSSAGIGRTGTFIVCDISLRQAIKERMINIPTVTQKIRRYRKNMVENAQQYVFAHLVMVECLMVQRTRIPCTDQLQEKIDKLRKQLPSDIQRLKRMVWQDKELHALATRPHIVDDAIPNRLWEPYEDDPSLAELSPAPTPNTWDGCFFVVSVEGVQRKEQYLATRSPSPYTLPDLWKLVTEKKIELIVVLQQPEAGSTLCCDIIQDDLGSLHIFHTQVEVKSTLEEGEYFTQAKFLLTDTSQGDMSAHPVTILTCKGWPYEENGTPPPVAQLVSIWMASEKVQRKESPVLVVCRDGVTGCGLYLAMSLLLDRMSTERQCDVISAVRAIQRFEPKFMQSLKQFEYLYDAAINYNSYFATYAN